METAIEVLIVAFTFAAGGYLLAKPEHVYAMVLKGRGGGESRNGDSDSSSRIIFYN